MDTFQIILVYVISWWMVLFMVLPFRAHAPKNPAVGHAQSAPENPRLRQKLIWTTGLAALVTGLIYMASGFISLAHAEEEIYHASSAPKTGKKCKTQAYHAPADINATEGTGTHGKQVAPATIGGGAATPTVDVNLSGDPYVSPPAPNTTPAAPNSYLGLGKVAVGADGAVTMDGKALAPAQEECVE